MKYTFSALLSNLSYILTPLQHKVLQMELDYLLYSKEEKIVSENMPSYFSTEKLDLEDTLRKCEILSLSISVEKKENFLKILQALDEKIFSVEKRQEKQNDEHWTITYLPFSLSLCKFFFKENYEDPQVDIDLQEGKIFQRGDSVQDFLFSAFLLARFPMQEGKNIVGQFLGDGKQISKGEHNDFLSRILLARKPSCGIYYLEEAKLLSFFLPEVSAGLGLSQNRFHVYDIFEHLLKSCDGVHEADLVLRWSALLHDIGKVSTRRLKKNGEASFFNHEIVAARKIPSIMKRLGIGKEEGQQVKFLVQNHMFHYTDEWTDKAIRRFMRKVPPEFFDRLIALRIADRKGSGKRNYFPPSLVKLQRHIETVKLKEREMKITDLDIDGNDLKEMGLSAGPIFGYVLKSLLEMVKNQEVENLKDSLLPLAKDLAEKSVLQQKHPYSHEKKFIQF